MGAEIVEQAIPAFERKWDRAFRDLCRGNLFSREPELAKRRFPATPVGEPRLVVGREYVSQLRGPDLCVIDDGSVIAQIRLPVEEQNRVRNAGCGVAIVQVEEEVRPISGVADVIIR